MLYSISGFTISPSSQRKGSWYSCTTYKIFWLKEEWQSWILHHIFQKKTSTATIHGTNIQALIKLTIATCDCDNEIFPSILLLYVGEMENNCTGEEQWKFAAHLFSRKYPKQQFLYTSKYINTNADRCPVVIWTEHTLTAKHIITCTITAQ